MTDAILDLTIIPIELATGGSFVELVTDPADTALRAATEAVGSQRDGELNVVILVIQPSVTDPATHALHEAAFQALRGIVGALTLELPGRLRLNLIRADSTVSAWPTLTYLGRADAAFVAGSTIDLTGDFE